MKARTYFTDRCGGVSSGSYSELNLATHVGDKLDDVLINREKFAHLLGVEKSHVYYMNQVHGHAISVITPLSDSTLAPSVDALFTTEPGRALVVLTADCIPLLLTSDRAEKVLWSELQWRPSRPSIPMELHLKRSPQRWGHQFAEIVMKWICPCMTMSSNKSQNVPPLAKNIPWISSLALKHN